MPESGVLLVEQRVRDALEFADRAYVPCRGARWSFPGLAAEIAGRIDEIERTYLELVRPLPAKRTRRPQDSPGCEPTAQHRCVVGRHRCPPVPPVSRC